MANPVIGYVTCPHCGGNANVSRTVKQFLCISCPDGCFQQFTRSQKATNDVLAKMRPVNNQESSNGKGKDQKTQGQAGPSRAGAETRAAAGRDPAGSGSGNDDQRPAAAGGGERRRGRFGIGR